jgi:hypothetical protein
MTHDYERHGTTTLFAALSMLDGKVIGDCMPRHRHHEFIRFLNKIDAETPSNLDLHLIVDNYATHKHPRVKSWLRRHPRFHIPLHPDVEFLVESGRALVSRDYRQADSAWQLSQRPGIDCCDRRLPEMSQPKPRVFVWKASADSIMTKIAKCKEALGTLLVTPSIPPLHEYGSKEG